MNFVSSGQDKLDRWISTVLECNTLSEVEVRLVCEKAKEIFINECNIQTVKCPVTICGDIHGQFHDLVELFNIGGFIPDTNYLFMGDYVDRGEHSVETITLLLLLKIRYPERICLLRGNHESQWLTKQYGFYQECVYKYGDATVWKYFTDLFMYMPICAIIEGEIFSVHGGLSPSLSALDQIREFNRVSDYENRGIMFDLMWSDPSEEHFGWKPSPREAGYTFGNDVTQKFVYENSLSLIVRGHQVVMDGFEWSHNKCLSTVFSAPNYCYRVGNSAAILKFDENMQYEFMQFGPSDKSPSL